MEKVDVKKVLVEKHCQAHEWGGEDAEECTLILTGDESAKAFAIAGFSVVGRKYYGVFPLGNTLLNMKDATQSRIMQNAEFSSIKKIMGLQQGQKYDTAESLKTLKYGHVMIMTDQGHEGSHVKGLLINMFHSFWPELLKIPNFLLEFITPIIKAKHRDGERIQSFYTLPQYQAWKENLGPDVENWTIKHYEGLGTSTPEEAKEYFHDLEKHKKGFLWVGDEDDEITEVAFSKKKIKARKDWLQQFKPGTSLDVTDKCISYRDFFHKELILFSIADLHRSVPSMVDGLKPGQRKILFCSFKRNFVKEAKVSQFAGYVSEHSAYHQGEKSLIGTIVGRAQDFVGSNNINLLLPNGHFGTRGQGGKDHASAWYIFTQLSPLARFIFPKADDILLDYLREDGQSIEPTWYVPIIPMVLVNGNEGIGTGWSSMVPNYNPLDVISNIRHLLKDEPMEAMNPWYRGYTGSIKKNRKKDAVSDYVVCGNIEEMDESTIRITELPIRKWTQDYKKFLDSVSVYNERSRDPFIEDVCDNSGGDIVNFLVTLSKERLHALKQEDLLKKLKLIGTISTKNMHLFDHSGVIKKYDSPEQILVDFFHIRMDFYGKRKMALVANLENERLKCENKWRFIQGGDDGSIIFTNRKKADLFSELKEKGFTPLPKKKNDEAGYDYLISMPIGHLSCEKMRDLSAEMEKLVQEIEVLNQTSLKTLWMRDLDVLESKIFEYFQIKTVVLDLEDEELEEHDVDVVNEADQVDQSSKKARIYYPSRDDPEAIEICYSDLECLAPESYLSSPIMNFYIRYLQKPNFPRASRKRDYHIFNTYFYEKLKQEGLTKTCKEASFAKLRRWWKGVNIFEKAYIFLPIHGNSHWSLVIICVSNKENESRPTRKDESALIILHLDSLGLHCSKSIFSNVKSFLIGEWNLLRKEVLAEPPIAVDIWNKLSRRIDEKVIKVPQQRNEYDCGLFVLYFMERFLEEAPERLKQQDLEMFGRQWFRPEEASGLRRKIRDFLREEFGNANEDST